ncbi:MAG: Gfo/Idh/MocA family oxidoreductase [Verrucomicrobiales bacterium]|nr:Gfo/Idh/MocA family oxidoreductase [Verrucomicrobiales bacterium]
MKRRHFLGTTAIGFPALLQSAGSPSGKVNIACVGVGGKGFSDMKELSVGHNIAAICDIDEQRLAKAATEFPGAKKYTDWRKLLEQADIDAVSVTTPDHTHAPVTMSAMDLGKHVYTQKPLTHTIFEARRLTEVAAEKGLITQMGIQHHATRRIKTAVHAIREDGVIGKVREVHTWTDRPGTFWKQGLDRPPAAGAAPSHIHWDQWIGTSPIRPYVSGAYHPFHWRGWWDFGTGVAGDMGCHILDPVVDALRLGPPKTVRAEGPPPHPESGPTWCIINYEFPGTRYTADTLKLTWYEAGKMPPRELFQAPANWPGSKNGVLFVGEKGNLFVGFPEMPELFPKEKFADYRFPDIPDHFHYREWTAAVAGNGTTSCPFSYSGPLTETVLLGNVAYRSGETIEWDSGNLKVVNSAEATRFIKREYRKGWGVTGLS